MRTPAWSVARRMLTASSIIAATVFAPHALADQKASGAGSIFRCDMPDGRVIFSDSRCTGAARIATWRPRTVLPGLHIEQPPVKIEEIAARAQEPVGPTLTTDAEPYTDCRSRGGQYRVASKLCILPSADPARP
ncbi:MAG: hypothetical protein R3E83_21370 [Burkholderiaceae bacterium]